MIATIHGSWWGERINDYLDNGDEKSALAAILVGSLLINKSMTESPTYADKNWGVNNSSPISIEANKMETASLVDIRKNAKKEGGVTIQLHYSGHDEYKNKINDGTAMIGRTLVIRDAPGGEDLEGVQWYAANFVVNYSGFGKLLIPMVSETGRHPWTGDKMQTKDKVKMSVGGLTDLLTAGRSQGAAVMNQGLNLLQEALNNASPETLEEIGIGREAIDILTSSNKVELFSNIIQAGLITDDLINKYFRNTTINEVESIDRESYIHVKDE